MIRTFALYLLLCIGCSAMAQQPSRALKNKVYAMLHYSVKQDWKSITEQTYPKIYDGIGKEAFQEIITQSFDNENFAMKILPVKKRDFLFSKINLQHRPESDYFFVKHPLKCEMRFKEEITNTELDIMKNAMQQAGFEVLESRKKKLKLLKSNSVMIGLRDEHTQEEWRFINNDAQIGQFIDDKITEAASAFALKQ